MSYKNLGIDFKREICSLPYEELSEWKSNGTRNLAKLRKKKKSEITVIIPTKNRGTEEYDRCVRNVIGEAVELLEEDKYVGISPISEVMVIDGSSIDEGPDPDYNKKIVDWALDKSERFKSELELVNPNEPKTRKFPLSFKILNQRDITYSDIVREDISPHLEKVYQDALEDVEHGKGPGYWLGIPTSAGNIISCIDSDIKPPKKSEMSIKDYIVALNLPIMMGDFNYGKTDYLRISESDGRKTQGGRINRNVYQTWIHAFQKLGFFIGLNHGHATSGECVIKRDHANEIEIGRGYRLEASLNMGSYFANRGDVTKMFQSNVGPWKQISSGEEAMGKMAGQVTEALISYAHSTGLRLSKNDFMKIYEIEFENNLQRTKKMIDKLPLAKQLNVVYEEKDMELDRCRVHDVYWPYIEEGVEKSLKAKGMLNLLPSWNSVKINVGDEGYRKLKYHMAEASTVYTVELADS